MKSCKQIVASVAIVLLVTASINCVNERHGKNIPTRSDSVSIEFDIHQDMDLIRSSFFGGPPQFAIWLQEPVSGRLQTVFVTHRSGTGDWEGKEECPVALPRWFEVFGEETGSTDLPTFERPAVDAVTGATPKVEEFETSVKVPFGSKWICWIEMNQSGDFNETYRNPEIEDKVVDVHFSGQPPLVYRGEITAIPGEKMTPKLYGESILDEASGVTIQPVSKGITTAKDIFKSIEIRVISTE